MILIGYNPYLDIIVKQYACQNKDMYVLQDIIKYAYGKKHYGIRSYIPMQPRQGYTIYVHDKLA